MFSRRGFTGRARLAITPDMPTPDRLILRGAVSTGFGFAIRLGARLIFLFVAGHLFGAVLFGAYSLGVAIVEASVGLAGLSLKKTLFQMLDRHATRNEAAAFHVVIDAAILVVAASAALAAAIMVTVSILAGGVLPEATATALFWLAPMIAGQNLVDILLAATRWKHAIRYEVIGRSIVEPYALLLAALGAYYAGFSALGLIVGYWAGNIAINLFALFGVRRCFPTLGLRSYRPDPGELAATLRWLLPNTATDLLSGLYARLDLYLVGILLGERASGIYSMAQQIRTPVRQVRQSFDGLLIPMVAKTLDAKGAVVTGQALTTAARFILAIQLPLLLAVIAVGGPLLEAVGPGFGIGYTALVLLTCAETIQGTLGLGDLLFVYLMPRAGLWITLASFVTGIGGALLLIPLWGIGGAAAAMLFAFSLQALLRRLTLGNALNVRPPLLFSAGPLLAGAAGLAAALAIRGVASGTAFDPRTILALLAGLAVYGAALALWLRLSGEKLAIKGFVAEAA